MFALEEKQRTVVLLRPDLLLTDSANPANKGKGKSLADDICEKFEEQYLEVKCRKQIYLTSEESEQFFHYLKPSDRKAAVAAFARGLCDVVVLEHLDGDVIERALKFHEELLKEYGAGSIYCSISPWECMRSLEFFFPHLDALPRERTLAIIKSDGIQAGAKSGQSLEQQAESLVALAGLLVVAKKQVRIDKTQAKLLCQDADAAAADQHVGVLTAEPGAIVMCIEGRGAIGRWQLLCGPENSGSAREIAPTTLRAIWGTDGTSNAVHASLTLDSSEQELQAFFTEGELKQQRTLCIIKPDAMPYLLQMRAELTDAGFTILKEKELKLTEERAMAFFQAHEDKPYYHTMVKEAISGPCVVAVLCRLEAVKVLQQCMGPASVKDARNLRPRSMRARYGRDGQRNAIHGSETAKAAAVEVRFFFPEMGADPVPDNDEVQDFLFRKSAVASMELKNLSEADSASLSNDPTLQQLLSQGLMALCQVQPKGLNAVKWLSRWMAENNPNKPTSDSAASFNPPQRASRFVEHGVSRDGLAFSVEPPPPAAKVKQVIDVDVSEEAQDARVSDMTTPPFVIFVTGGPGCGKATLCSKMKEEFSFVHLSVNDLMREEVAAETYLGTEIFKHTQMGTTVPDSIILQLLKKNMIKHQDTNRFLLAGFPRTVEQAKRFEQEVAEVAFVLNLDCSPQTMQKRIEVRLASSPGRVDDSADAVEKRMQSYETDTLPVMQYYTPIGRVRKVDAEKEADEVYTEAKRFVSCRFIYLVGPPGAPVASVADKLEAKYGYSAISMPTLLQQYAKSDGQDADKVRQALAKGKAVDASIACPLLVSEIFRDMALGVQNFVLCDFPQSATQARFLEHRIPCITKPMLLDFTRADAEDLAATAVGDALEMELRSTEFFSGDFKKLLEGPAMLSGLTRVPCSLAGVSSSVGSSSQVSREERVVDATWSGVCAKLMPGLTLVLGPPCSGTDVLAGLLATLTPNTQAVDCNIMLDRELERRTEAGISMHNMLARGQVVPLSMTLELLKDIVNLTCSDSLIIENCPMYVDQVEYITKEFRIDRVFYINGTDKAVANWRDAYVNANKSAGEDGSREIRAFDDRMDRMAPIVSHFARLGKLERLEVNDTPKDKKLAEEIKKSTVPQFAIVTGLSEVVAKKQADMLAAAYGVGPAITPEFLKEWCAAKFPARSVDVNLPAEVFAALQKYADATNYGFLVLNRYPRKQADAAAFLDEFGSPKVVVSVTSNDEFLKEELTAKHAEDENPPDDEAMEALVGTAKTTLEGTWGLFTEKCPTNTMSKEWDAETGNHDLLSASIREKLRPQVYAIVAPSGSSDFCNLVADAICTSKREGTRPRKYTVVDCNELVKPGRHGQGIEDRLAKASFGADAPDRLPVNLWIDLFKEAFAQSANPMGTFLVTNFPTPCSMTSNPTIPDQFYLLGEAANLMGTQLVKLSDAAFAKFCSQDAEVLAAYQAFDERVLTQGKVQFDRLRICESLVEGNEALDLVVAKVAEEFRDFQERAEKAPAQ